jgi:hypothetical protein
MNDKGRREQMNIMLCKDDVEKGRFWLDLRGEDLRYNINPNHLFVVFTKEELSKIVAYGIAELQDFEISVDKKP